MKLEIYEEEIKKEEPIKLALKATIDGIELQVVDSNGNRVDCGTLLTVLESGVVKMDGLVARDLGFKLDECKRVEVGFN